MKLILEWLVVVSRRPKDRLFYIFPENPAVVRSDNKEYCRFKASGLLETGRALYAQLEDEGLSELERKVYFAVPASNRELAVVELGDTNQVILRPLVKLQSNEVPAIKHKIESSQLCTDVKWDATAKGFKVTLSSKAAQLSERLKTYDTLLTYCI